MSSTQGVLNMAERTILAVTTLFLAVIAAEALGRWGCAGLVSLAYAISMSREFRMLKRVLGHGHACRRLAVGATIPPVKGAVR
jgi:hypothetical protein